MLHALCLQSCELLSSTNVLRSVEAFAAVQRLPNIQQNMHPKFKIQTQNSNLIKIELGILVIRRKKKYNTAGGSEERLVIDYQQRVEQ